LQGKASVEYNALMLLYSEEDKKVDMFGAKDKEQLQDLAKISSAIKHTFFFKKQSVHQRLLQSEEPQNCVCFNSSLPVFSRID